MEEELLALMALSEVPGIGLMTARNLLAVMENATDVFKKRESLQHRLPGLPGRVIEALGSPDPMRRAEKELRFVQDHAIQCLPFYSEGYPSRLRECDDAPILLYYRGKADLNAVRVVSVVGTRHMTPYGQQMCVEFLHDLKALVPDVLVVSGLAYGVDVQAHRSAMENGLPTVGVLAHGLDRIYPSVHNRIARAMLEQGGLLTEYKTETRPDRQNFIARNRIVAGMADAIVVVESAQKGGSLITASVADSYHRECFAFPGRAIDEFSQGCNNLIFSGKAALIQSAEDFAKAMRWDAASCVQKPWAVQRQLFVDLSPEEQRVVDLLKERGDLQINTLVVEANIPVNKMSVLLFELEIKGVLRGLAGGMYHLL